MAEEKENNEDLIFSIGDVVSGYTITEKIDEGGFGQVFKVMKDNKIYAMKIESNSQEGGSAIKLEIDVLMHLKSKGVNNFPMVYTAGRKPRFHFLVMELLGDNLKTLRFKSPNPVVLSPGTWSRIGIQCLYCIKLLHDNGFVHRDIKPSNFAMGYSSSDDVLKGRMIFLFDFGLARKFILMEKKMKKPGVGEGKEQNSAPQESLRERQTIVDTTKKSVVGSRRTKKPLDKEKEERAKVAKRMKTQRLSKPAAAETPTPAANQTAATPIPAKPNQDLSKCEDMAGSFNETPQYRYRQARPHTDFRGTQQYASPNAHAQIELGRADDVWSLMYMLAEMTYPLPWSTNEEIPIEELKKQTCLENLFKDDAFSKIDEMLKNCNYYMPPDYEMVYRTIKAIMEKSGSQWNDPYDWETDQSAMYVKWKEEKTKKHVCYNWEDPNDFFKKDVWASVPKPIRKKKGNTLEEKDPSLKKSNEMVRKKKSEDNLKIVANKIREDEHSEEKKTTKGTKRKKAPVPITLNASNRAPHKGAQPKVPSVPAALAVATPSPIPTPTLPTPPAVVTPSGAKKKA